MPHVEFTLLLAFLLSLALAFAENRPVRESLYRAAYLFISVMTVAVAGSWAMRLIHG